MHSRDHDWGYFESLFIFVITTLKHFRNTTSISDVRSYTLKFRIVAAAQIWLGLADYIKVWAKIKVNAIKCKYVSLNYLNSEVSRLIK